MKAKVRIVIKISSHTLTRALKYVNQNVSLDQIIEQAVQSSVIRREEKRNETKAIIDT
jgi:hypothetical protein